MRVILKIILAITVSFPALAISQQSVQTGSGMYEVFLLAPRLHYTYDYYNSSGYSDELYSVVHVDSGAVEYVVVDSTVVDDTTVAWQVLEYRTLWHKIMSSFPLEDTVYFSIDTTTLTLYENTIGDHPIHCTGTVWNFPLNPVYRYTDSSEVTIMRQWSTPFPTPGGGSDTLRLSISSGPFFRHSISWLNNAYIYSSGETRFSLRGYPTSVTSRGSPIPRVPELAQNYPNPFNPLTVIRYQLTVNSFVSLKVYSLIGQEITTLVSGNRNPGTYEATFDGIELPSGVYFYRLQAGEFVETKKLLLIK